MSGVLFLRTSDFFTQNVVSRLLVSGHHTFSEQEIRNAVLWSASLSDFSPDFSDEEMSSKVAAIVDGSLRLMVLEPSVGCELACVCREVALMDNGEAMIL